MHPTPHGPVPSPSRLPFSRAFAQVGFTRSDADRWRRAGWDDAEEAASWRHLEDRLAPDVLRSMADEGTTAADVDRLVQRFPELTGEALRQRVCAYLGLSETEIDLRERVRENLHLGLSGPRHPIGA